MGRRDTNRQEIKAHNLQRAIEARERKRLNPKPAGKRRKRYLVRGMYYSEGMLKINEYFYLAYSEEEAKQTAQTVFSESIGYKNFTVTSVQQKNKREKSA